MEGLSSSCCFFNASYSSYSIIKLNQVFFSMSRIKIEKKWYDHSMGTKKSYFSLTLFNYLPFQQEKYFFSHHVCHSICRFEAASTFTVDLYRHKQVFFSHLTLLNHAPFSLLKCPYNSLTSLSQTTSSIRNQIRWKLGGNDVRAIQIRPQQPSQPTLATRQTNRQND